MSKCAIYRLGYLHRSPWVLSLLLYTSASVGRPCKKILFSTRTCQTVLTWHGLGDDPLLALKTSDSPVAHDCWRRFCALGRFPAFESHVTPPADLFPVTCGLATCDHDLYQALSYYPTFTHTEPLPPHAEGMLIPTHQRP